MGMGIIFHLSNIAKIRSIHSMSKKIEQKN